MTRKTLIQALCCLLLTVQASAQPRKAMVDIAVEQDTASGKLVVHKGTTVGKKALLAGDTVLTVNERRFSDKRSFATYVASLREGETISARIKRNRKEQTIAWVLPPKPFVTLEGADVRYGWVPFRGGSLRSITYHPTARANGAGVFLVQGYDCGSIENFPASFNGSLIKQWLKAGYTVMTVEKSGVGDSYQLSPCNAVDLATDIASFETALRQFKTSTGIDSNKVFIWGHSLGATIAPIIANRVGVKGIMVYGGVFRPWSEFLLEMHRLQKPLLEGWSMTATETFIRNLHPVYTAFFLQKKSPAELAQVPAFAALVKEDMQYQPGSHLQWSRHWRFWQQLDSVNLTQEWTAVAVPTLILHGGTDYEQCSLLEPTLTHRTMEAAHPGLSQLKIIPNADHFYMRSKTYEEAVRNFRSRQYTKGNFNTALSDASLEWMKQQLQQK